MKGREQVKGLMWGLGGTAGLALTTRQCAQKSAVMVGLSGLRGLVRRLLCSRETASDCKSWPARPCGAGSRAGWSWWCARSRGVQPPRPPHHTELPAVRALHSSVTCPHLELRRGGDAHHLGPPPLAAGRGDEPLGAALLRRVVGHVLRVTGGVGTVAVQLRVQPVAGRGPGG